MAISDFRIQVGGTDGEIYELSVTTDVSVSSKSKISRFKVESKEIITENKVDYNREITYNGIITQIRRFDQGSGDGTFNITGIVFQGASQALANNLPEGELRDYFDRQSQSAYKNPKTYLEGLEKVKQGEEYVTCFLPNNLNPIENCLIEDLNYTKTMDQGQSSWRVSIKLCEIRLTQRAVETSIPKPEVKDDVEKKTDAGNATTKEQPVTTTIGVDLFSNPSGSFFGGLGG